MSCDKLVHKSHLLAIWTQITMYACDSLQRTGSWESFVCDLNYTDCAVLTACGIINTERTNSACWSHYLLQIIYNNSMIQKKNDDFFFSTALFTPVLRSWTYWHRTQGLKPNILRQKALIVPKPVIVHSLMWAQSNILCIWMNILP